MRYKLLIATVVVFLTRPASDAVAGITIEYSSFYTLTDGDYLLGGQDSLELWRSTAAVPYHDEYVSTYTYRTGDVTTSRGTIDHSYNSVTTVLQYDFEHHSRRFGSVDTVMEYLYFIPSVDSTYFLSGSYQFDFGNGQTGNSHFGVSFYEVSDTFNGTNLFIFRSSDFARHFQRAV